MTMVVVLFGLTASVCVLACVCCIRHITELVTRVDHQLLVSVCIHTLGIHRNVRPPDVLLYPLCGDLCELFIPLLPSKLALQMIPHLILQSVPRLDRRVAVASPSVP